MNFADVLENENMRQSNLNNFYSNNMVVSKDHINLNYLRLTYQRISLKDLEKKHKKMAQDIYGSKNLNLFINDF